MSRIAELILADLKVPEGWTERRVDHLPEPGSDYPEYETYILLENDGHAVLFRAYRSPTEQIGEATYFRKDKGQPADHQAVAVVSSLLGNRILLYGDPDTVIREDPNGLFGYGWTDCSSDCGPDEQLGRVFMLTDDPHHSDHFQVLQELQ